MGIVFLIARLVLAGVFAVAGVAKLAALRDARRGVADFGVPHALAGIVGVALPFAELAVAGALLPAASAPWAGVAALALLFAFTAAIGLALARGRTPDCQCFGNLHSAPVGPRALVRNAVLAGIAGLVAAGVLVGDAGPSAVGWLGALEPIEQVATGGALLAVAVAAFSGWLAVRFRRESHRLLLRVHLLEQAGDFDSVAANGLLPGTQAPGFSLAAVDGEQTALDDLLGAGRSLVLIFADSGCGACHALMPDISRWQREHADDLTVAVVWGGSPSDVQGASQEHGLRLVLSDPERQLSDLYAVAGTPSAVLIGPGGTVEEPLAEGADAVEQLVEDALRSGWGSTRAEALSRLQLPDLEDGRVALRDLVGSETVLLFWNADCGFCRELHADVLAWEAEAGPDAPRLVILAAGEVAGIRAEGFDSIVLHDEHGEAATLLGSPGTPSALLLDAEGHLSRRAVGAEEVLELLDRAPTATAGSGHRIGDILVGGPTSRRQAMRVLAGVVLAAVLARPARAGSRLECLPGHYPCGGDLCCDSRFHVCCRQDPLNPCCDRRTSVCEDKCRDRCPKGWSACGKGEAAGKTGCCNDLVEECVRGRCLAKCPPGATRCGTKCCGRGFDCLGGKCVPVCRDGSPRCGKKCCPDGQRCADPRKSRCERCARGREACGPKCCPKGSYCCDDRKGLCCPKSQTCCNVGPFGGPEKWVCCPEECGDETTAKDGGFARSGAAAICCPKNRYVEKFRACCPPGWKVLKKPTFGIEWCCPAEYECNGICCTNPITTKGLPPELARVCRNGVCVPRD